MLRPARLGIAAALLFASVAIADTLSQQPSYDDNTGSISQTISSGNTGAAIYVRHFPITITAVPGGGGTMTVQYTTSQFSAIAANTATWITWSLGTVSSSISDVPWGPITAVRASAATADGKLEVVQ